MIDRPNQPNPERFNQVRARDFLLGEIGSITTQFIIDKFPQHRGEIVRIVQGVIKERFADIYEALSKVSERSTISRSTAEEITEDMREALVFDESGRKVEDQVKRDEDRIAAAVEKIQKIPAPDPGPPNVAHLDDDDESGPSDLSKRFSQN